MVKNKLKIMLVIVITAILVSGLSVYATYNYFAKDISYTKANGEIISVESALNELYNKNNIVDIENIWASCNQNIDYTYTAEKSGIYLVGILNCNNDGIKGTIITDAQTLLEKSLENGEAYTRYITIKLLKVEKNEKIEVKGYNGRYVANAFIYKLNDITISSILNSNMVIDNTANISYVADKNDDRVLVLGISCGESRTGNISFDGAYLSQTRKNNDVYLGWSVLNKDAKVTISSYGYNWGAGAVFIFK